MCPSLFSPLIPLNFSLFSTVPHSLLYHYPLLSGSSCQYDLSVMLTDVVVLLWRLIRWPSCWYSLVRDYSLWEWQQHCPVSVLLLVCHSSPFPPLVSLSLLFAFPVTIFHINCCGIKCQLPKAVHLKPKLQLLFFFLFLFIWRMFPFHAVL